MNTDQRKKTREITGRTVLFSLIGFFAVVMGVNAVLVKAATSTFGGVEVSSSYKAGLMFKDEVAQANRQEGRHWLVAGKLTRDGAGEAVLDVTAKDGAGVPLSGLRVVARLAHPADERQDRVITLDRIGSGEFRGTAQAQSGQWELLLDLYRDEERVFRSRSRVTLN